MGWYTTLPTASTLPIRYAFPQIKQTNVDCAVQKARNTYASSTVGNSQLKGYIVSLLGRDKDKRKNVKTCLNDYLLSKFEAGYQKFYWMYSYHSIEKELLHFYDGTLLSVFDRNNEIESTSYELNFVKDDYCCHLLASIVKIIKSQRSRSLTGSLENAKNSSTFSDKNRVGTPDELSVTRINPFKRRRSEFREKVTIDETLILDDSNANDPFSNEKVLLRTNKMKHSSSGSFVTDINQSCKQLFATDFSDILQCSAAPSPTVIDSYSSNKIPIDLRLGTKMRIISSKPFLWMKDAASSGVVPVRVTGQQQHEGLQIFLSNVASDVRVAVTIFNPSVIVSKFLQFNSLSSSDITSNSSPMALLESACLYWQFPCFPWLSTYPRADSLVKANASITQTIPTLAQPCLEALDLQCRVIYVLTIQFLLRTECFDQLFLSWKKGDRRSFYMLCSLFTILFTKISFGDNSGMYILALDYIFVIWNFDWIQANVLAISEDSLSCFHASGGLKHVAIITPTSPGFRSYLKTEGIEYEILRKKKVTNMKLSPEFKIDRGEDSKLGFDSFDVTQSQPPMFSFEKADLSGDHEWLENIDMSPRNTAKLKRYKSLGATCRLNKDDSQLKTCSEEVVGVMIKGSEVQTLYNLLQSSRIGRSITGPHANLPPTLIAAQPFVYSQMHTLKVR
ncbi:hypothetical protein DICVIV_04399 [Dictyocaulus viviparus]|uniref:Uncharacterized protein n=1 Tax=Dictyocaulus viviparus TaxID=29172 RepID=A0A0D8XZZ9_DICVI|nr:hypothetical protein DICVIV_04399 [Dictyocaulus viviparus]